jgi:hypothetical protein
MFVLLEDFLDVSRHRKVNCASIVIPLELDTAVEIAGPVFGEFVFLFYARDQVVDVFFSNVFDAEIVDD